MARLLGIDAGTTSVSVLLFDSRTNKILYSRSVPHHADISGLNAGYREQNPEIIYSMALPLIDPDIQPDAVCVTGQMHGMLLLGDEGDIVQPAVTWEDTRIVESGELEDFTELFSNSSTAAEGASSGPGYAASTIFWLARNGQLPPASCTMCSLQDWLVYKLSGGSVVVTDPSCAHSTGLYRPKSDCWDVELAGTLGFDQGALPEIVPAGSVAGSVQSNPVLVDGIPVCTGLGDNQASFVGTVGDPEETALVNVGTGSQVSVLLPEYRIIEGVDVRPLVEGRFIGVGAPLCGGSAFEAVKDFAAGIGRIVFNHDCDSDRIYASLLECANLNTDLVADTAFLGSRNDPARRGSFANVTVDNFQIGDVAGAVLSGVADELYRYYKKCGVSVSSLVGAGNGLQRNRLLAQAVSEKFGLPLRLSGLDEGAALGAALSGGVGVGAYENFGEVAKVIHQLNTEEKQ